MIKPRELTSEEMRNAIFQHMAVMLKWWRDETPERLTPLMANGQSELQARMEGFLFSLLVMFDGGASIPALAIIPIPHEDDEAFHRSEGTNWWAGSMINDDVEMHEVFPWELCR